MEEHKNQINPSRIQAETMAKSAGITLTEDQINQYIELRQKEPMNLSDQTLLMTLINSEQRPIFAKHYSPNIFGIR